MKVAVQSATAWVAAAIMSRSFTKPLYSLIDRMHRDRDPAGLLPRERPRNEIAILNERYDSIIERLERVRRSRSSRRSTMRRT